MAKCSILTCQNTIISKDSKNGYCNHHYKVIEDYDSYYGISE